jgi:hypothetical protein
MPLRDHVAAMALGLMNNARYWRRRADEVLTFAEDTLDPEARTIMLRIVADYDRLAVIAEKRNAETDVGLPLPGQDFSSITSSGSSPPHHSRQER